MANESIRQLADALGMATARLSGDPQRMQMALGLQQSRKLQEQENKLNQWIGENIPESQQRFLQALSYSDKIKTILSAQKPVKGPSSYEEYIRTDPTPTNEEYATFLKSQAEAGATKIDYGQKGFQELGPKKYNERYEASQQASNSLTTVENLTNILDQGLQTGFGEQSKLALNRALQFAFGQDFKPVEVASAEAFAAGTTKMILPLVKELGVNPTDKDLDFVVKGSAELSKSVAGNRLMLKAVELSARRAQDEHRFDNEFYGKPENRGKTEVDRNIAFEIYKQTRPDLYSAAPLIQEYNNFLEIQGQKSLQSGDFTSTQEIDLPPDL